jgi:adenosine deaminase
MDDRTQPPLGSSKPVGKNFPLSSNRQSTFTPNSLNPIRSVHEPLKAWPMTKLVDALTDHLIRIISETNGITLSDTLELASNSHFDSEQLPVKKSIIEFRKLLSGYQQDELDISTLLNHPMSMALFQFFHNFPLPYREEHIHLTGSLSAEFIYPRIKKLLAGPHKKIYEKQIINIYGEEALPIKSVEDVENLIRLKDDELFDRYLQILLLPKLILTNKKAHKDAAYHMASELYHKYNVGMIRLKFSISRATKDENEKIPGLENITEEDVVMGLFEGFMQFKNEVPEFNFVLSPSFRKEQDFYDPSRFSNKQEHFLNLIDTILALLDKHPELTPYLTDVDTVGNEKNLYRKAHFKEMQYGFRKLQYKGFSIRSHHGETWHTLRKGVQAVDNSLNIWHLDTLEHGLSLGVNPNYYYHSLFQRIVVSNQQGEKIKKDSSDYKEVMEMEWTGREFVREKLIKGQILNEEEITLFLKAKFHTAREVEAYQHDVLNTIVRKNVSLIALPSSNIRLTACFPDHKDHPFSWWEKKGVQLGIGTDNYITLNTNYIKELLIVLYTDADNLKITKLLMVATGENRRPYLSQLLWKMREQVRAGALSQ